jgi:hypothetical protein
MQEPANATCAQVIGAYNATGGMRAGIRECLTNIAKNSDAPAVDTLQARRGKKGNWRFECIHSCGVFDDYLPLSA